MTQLTEQDYKKEIWTPIKGFESYYHISSLGRIRRLARIGIDGRRLKEKIKQNKSISNTYVAYHLQIGKKIKSGHIHRLIAENFLDNRNNFSDVNHKNGIKNDNRLDNLEWMTRSDNVIHAYKSNLHKKHHFYVSKNKVLCIETGILYQSAQHAAIMLYKTFNTTIGSVNSGIRNVCGKKLVRHKWIQKTAFGFTWKYINE